MTSASCCQDGSHSTTHSGRCVNTTSFDVTKERNNIGNAASFLCADTEAQHRRHSHSQAVNVTIPRPEKRTTADLDLVDFQAIHKMNSILGDDVVIKECSALPNAFSSRPSTLLELLEDSPCYSPYEDCLSVLSSKKRRASICSLKSGSLACTPVSSADSYRAGSLSNGVSQFMRRKSAFDSNLFLLGTPASIEHSYNSNDEYYAPIASVTPLHSASVPQPVLTFANDAYSGCKNPIQLRNYDDNGNDKFESFDQSFDNAFANHKYGRRLSAPPQVMSMFPRTIDIDDNYAADFESSDSECDGEKKANSKIPVRATVMRHHFRRRIKMSDIVDNVIMQQNVALNDAVVEDAGQKDTDIHMIQSEAENGSDKFDSNIDSTSGKAHAIERKGRNAWLKAMILPSPTKISAPEVKNAFTPHCNNAVKNSTAGDIPCVSTPNFKRRNSYNDGVSCIVCAKSFSKVHQLKSHMKCHVEFKTHICSVCGICFSRHHDLLRHMVSHSDSKPFNCPTCLFRFSRKDALNRHIKNVHGA